jgi:hypothetical protein
VLLLHCKVVIGNGNDRGLLSGLASRPSMEGTFSRKALLEQVESTLRMLERRLVATELRQGRAKVQVCSCWIVDLI